MRQVHVLVLAVFALAAVGVFAAAHRHAPAEEARSNSAVVTPQERKACGEASRHAFAEVSAENISSGQSVDAKGPRTLESSGEAQRAWWGSCLDCSSCLSADDCAHVGGPCYDHCP